MLGESLNTGNGLQGRMQGKENIQEDIAAGRYDEFLTDKFGENVEKLVASARRAKTQKVVVG